MAKEEAAAELARAKEAAAAAAAEGDTGTRGQKVAAKKVGGDACRTYCFMACLRCRYLVLAGGNVVLEVCVYVACRITRGVRFCMRDAVA